MRRPRSLTLPLLAIGLTGALAHVASPALAATGQWKAVPDVVVTDPAVQNLHVSPSHAYGAVLSWDNGSSVYVSVQSATGGFSNPIEVTNGLGSSNVAAVSADIAPNGTVVVGWAYESPITYERRAWASVRPPGGTFGAPQVVSDNALFVNSLVTRITPDGTAYFAFSNYDTGISASKISYTTRSAAGTIDPLTLVQSGSIYGAPDTFEMDAAGQLTFVWRNTSHQIVSKTLPFGETLSGLTQLSAPGHQAHYPTLSVASSGDTLVAWTDTVSGTTRIRGSARPAGGAWGAPTTLTSGNDRAADGGAYAPNLSLGADGTTAVAWVVQDPSRSYQSTVKVALQPPGGSWSSDLTVAATTLSSDLEYQYSPRLITQPDGSVTATFMASGTMYTAILAAGDPTFGGLDTLLGGNTAGLAVKSDGVVSAFPKNATGFEIVSTEGPTATVTVDRTGDGSGTVTSDPAGVDCGARCTAPLPLNGSVALTAHAAEGSDFAGWSGACHGTERTCRFTLTASTTATARFERTATTPAAVMNTPSTSSLQPHAALIVLRSTTGCNGLICMTSGRLPANADAITQRATRLLATPSGTRAAGTRVARCTIASSHGERLFRCTLRLAVGRWSISTRAAHGATLIGSGSRSVRINAVTSEAVTG